MREIFAIVYGAVLLPALFLLYGCRTNEVVLPPEEEQKGDTVISEVIGLYLLNEGNMGTNKATLDYYDFTNATYTRNIYSAANPNIAQSLGDVGNDLKIYGKRLYAVINASNLIEVMDSHTAKHIGTIVVPNCRYLVFKGGYGYVTSYAGPITSDITKAQIGYVAKFDTASLQIVSTCLVGYQPDELEIVGNTLYVANSGGYMTPNYENTLSVIDLTTFKETNRIPVAVNMWRVRKDNHNQLWVTSRGNYGATQPKLYCIDTKQNKVVDSLAITVSDLYINGDSLYACSGDYYSGNTSYHIINTQTHKIVANQWFEDPTVEIEVPYGVMVHPQTKDIFVTDAKNYVEPGALWCIGQDGKSKWSVRTGDIPAHFALLYKTTK